MSLGTGAEVGKLRHRRLPGLSMRRDASFLLVARVVSAFTTVLVLALIARVRTQEELGVVALGLTLSLALAVLPEAGLTSLFIYDSATEPARTGHMLGSLLLLRAVSLPLTALALGVIVAVAYPDHALTMMVIAIGPALQQISELGRSVFIARGRMAVASAHSIAENLAWAGAIAAGIALGTSLDVMFAAAALAVIVCMLAVFALAALLEGVLPGPPTRPDLASIVSRAGSFAAFSALAVVGARMDTFLIGLMLPGGVAVAGAYYAIARLVAAAEYVPDAVSRAIYPTLVREQAMHPGAPSSVLARTLRDMVALGIAIPFGFALVGRALIELIYGPDLTSYAWLFIAFGVAMPFRYVGFVFGVAATSAGLQGRRARAMAVAVAISLGLNVILLPTIGVAGALVAGIAGWLANCLLLSSDVFRTFGPVLSVRDLGRPSAVALVAFLCGLGIGAIIPGLTGELSGERSLPRSSCSRHSTGNVGFRPPRGEGRDAPNNRRARRIRWLEMEDWAVLGSVDPLHLIKAATAAKRMPS